MLNGIDLFSGYAGITVALSEYVQPIIYCEKEEYAKGILVSRMEDETIPFAPIWNDVTTLDGKQFKGLVDIVYGGFPCQDISVAGKGAGLDGKRSGLFYEVVRICKEASPQFIFLENVPAIRTRGSIEVQEAMAIIGYDCRWCTLSASEVGANHKRERWFLLAYANHDRQRITNEPICELGRKSSTNPRGDGEVQSLANANGLREQSKQISEESSTDRISDCGTNGEISNTDSIDGHDERHGSSEIFGQQWQSPVLQGSKWWATEPDVGRVANGVANRAHRIKSLGNGVVPLQVKTAFEKLMGIGA